MTRIIVTALAVATLMSASGCVHHHRAPLDAAGFRGESVKAINLRGESVRVRAVRGADGVRWYTDDGHVVSPLMIRKLETVNHGRGLLEGLGIGALTGATVGAVVGFAAGDDPECEQGSWFCLRFSAGEKATFGAVTFGAAGAAAGAVIGLIAGSRDVYEEPAEDGALPRVTVTPAAGGATGALTWSF